jgi:hypothetical protein
MKFKRLLKLLLEGTGESTEPIFSAASLKDACPEAFALLKAKKVLQRVATPETLILEGSYGAVRQVSGKWFWISLGESAAPWVEVGPDALETYKLSHRRLLAWLAECCSTSKEVNADGMVWSLGSVIIQGRRCQVLYYPGTASKANFLEAIRDLESAATEIPRVLLLPVGVSLDAVTESRWQERGLSAQHLYGVATETGFDLEKAKIPAAGRSAKPGYYFRRSADGWEVGFNTTKPRAVKDKSGMEAIWWLLRNPGNKRTAEQLLLELAGLDPGKSPVMSAGSRAKSVKDLPSDVKAKLQELYQEAGRCREDQDERGLADAQEEIKVLFKQYGIKDPFAGKVEREGDDKAKAGNSLGVAIGRCFSAFKKTKELEGLADHLEAYIDRWTSFSYDPPGEIQWITT